jgi:hypothetical protein
MEDAPVKPGTQAGDAATAGTASRVAVDEFYGG